MHCGDQRQTALWLGRRLSTRHNRVQGRSQGTTLSASDLHNARANILNSFYNMEYKVIKKIWQNKVWIEAGIPCINISPIRHNAFALVIVYFNNDVIIPFNFMTWQINTKATQRTLFTARARMRPNLFEISGSAARTYLLFDIQGLNHEY